MSLRWKLGLTVGFLLLAMVALVSVSAYLTTDRRLYEEVDNSLDDRASAIRLVLNRIPFTTKRPTLFPRDTATGSVGPRLPESASPAQLIDPDGKLVQTVGSLIIPIDDAERALAVSGGRSSVRSVEVEGHPYRLETVPLPRGGAVQVGRELAPTRDTLASLRRRYAASSALVALLGVILGWLLAGWLTRPVARLTAAAEHVASTGDLEAAIETEGRDETSRLSQAFSSMLAALRESRHRQRQLVQDASHELRTPVTAIRTNVDVLRRHPQLDPVERAKVLDDVNTELTQVTTMVDELVLLASGDGTLSDIEGPVALDDVVGAAVEQARRRHGRPMTIDVEPTMVSGSQRGLDRAVSNLLDNACKFSPADSPVEVCLRHGRLEVRDHGPGIAAEDLPQVFARFYRATTARTQPGSGLGLAIVDQVARAHGGHPFAENHPGGGAVVGFELPVLAGA